MGPVRATTHEASPVRFEFVDVRLLHAHERVDPALLDHTADEIRRDGFLKKPILVADVDYVILDGHHRYEALRALGCRRVPAYVIDYRSDVVQLGLWPEAEVKEITKEEVLRRGLADDPFPPKTTRHTLRVALEEVFTDLEELF